MNAREQIIALYLDWVNNYLTVDVFAADHGLTSEEALQLINLGRDVSGHPHPEA